MQTSRFALLSAAAALTILLPLAAGALYTHHSARELERRFPPLGRFVDADGVSLHYVDTGPAGDPTHSHDRVDPPDAATTLVLLHGASTSLRDFTASILPLLHENHRVIAFDRPGHGYSERAVDATAAGEVGNGPDPARQAALIATALRRLGVRRALWVGHSWGGAVVLAGLLEHPAQAAGGVLLAGVSHPWRGSVSIANRLATLPLIGELFTASAVLPVGRWLLDDAVAGVFAPNPPPPDYRDRTGVALTLRPSAFRANAEDMSGLRGFLRRQSRRYAEIEQPLLLITGAADDVVPSWNHAERLQRQVVHAQRVDLPGVGHAPHHVRPARVSTLIARFAARL